MAQDDTTKSVLIVDDDEFLVNMYAKKFENEGFAVETTTTSQKALDTLEGGDVADIIVLDIIMPDIDGLDVLKKITEENMAPHSTIVMLTNQGGDEQIDKAKDLGASGYIVKATSIPSEVVQKVQEIADGECEHEEGTDDVHKDNDE